MTKLGKRINELESWKRLEKLSAGKGKCFDLKNAFVQDVDRQEANSIHWRWTEESDAPSIYYDYSKNLVDEEIMDSLFALLEESDFATFQRSLFAGEPINATENRAVLHMALRAQPSSFYDRFQKDIHSGRLLARKLYRYDTEMPDIYGQVHHELDKMQTLSRQVRSGKWLGYTGRPIESIVNIGIGGSDLGPKMVYSALQGTGEDGKELRGYFVSNVDAMDLAGVLAQCDPETTLFVIVSKTFTTQETMMNAKSARAWFLAATLQKGDLGKHFVAVSTNQTAIVDFGIPNDSLHVFSFWDFVGGRYSVWSVVGLSISLIYGHSIFKQLLEGAAMVDVHFTATANPRHNIPVVMALLGIWYNNFLQTQTHAVLPYEQVLKEFPAYLQQLDMESNGKSARKCSSDPSAAVPLDKVDISAADVYVDWQTGPIVWGQAGTNGQHAFYQLLHQGTKLVPIDFMGGKRARTLHKDASSTTNGLQAIDFEAHHKVLLANMIAQSEALMVGNTGNTSSRVYAGNKPSSVLLYDTLSPQILGAIIALYEHKVCVMGHIWQIYSFDQWGVELGKKLAGAILQEKSTMNTSNAAAAPSNQNTHDASTKTLLSLTNLS